MAKDHAASSASKPVAGNAGGVKLKIRVGGLKPAAAGDSENAEEPEQTFGSSAPKIKLSINKDPAASPSDDVTAAEEPHDAGEDSPSVSTGPRIKLSIGGSTQPSASTSNPVVARQLGNAQSDGSRGKKRKSIGSADDQTSDADHATSGSIKRKKSKLSLVVSADTQQEGEESDSGGHDENDEDASEEEPEQADVAAHDKVESLQKVEGGEESPLSSQIAVKDEPMDETPNDGTPVVLENDQQDETATPSQLDSAAQTPTEMPIAPSGRRGWAPKRKPLLELLRKYIVELRRKDTYGLFLEPVNEEEYPGYFDVIGGPDKAMDLATMERKIEDRVYRSFQQVEDDIDKMCSAAQKFNAEDSLVVKEAEKMRALSEKYRNRFEPLVLTPSPEPEASANATPFDSAAMSPANPWDTRSLGYTPGRSLSPGKASRAGDGKPRSKHISEIEPRLLIPEKMLEYPPNSAQAATVGWYLTGGKRQRTRKEQKSREKWDGQWREWYTCGPRRLPEAEDAPALMTDGFLLQGSKDGSALPEIYNFQAEIMEEQEIWQPTPTLTGVVIDEETPTIPVKLASHLDFGPFADLPSQYGHSETRRWTDDVLLDEIEGDLTRATDEHDSAAWVKAMTIGEDLRCEAYHRSLNGFVRGALGIANARIRGVTDIENPPDLSGDVYSRWRSGFVQSQRQLVDQTTREYRSSSIDRDSKPSDPLDLVGEAEPVDLIKATIAATKARLPIQRDLATYAARRDGLDLACLLKTQADFAYTGSFPNPPPPPGPEKIIWFQRIINGTGRQIVAIVEGSEQKPIAGKDALTNLRLDLLAIAKNVPVQELKPMTKEESERLPAAVRGLIKIV